MNEKVNNTIKKLKKILSYRDAIEDNAFSDNMVTNNEAIDDSFINSLDMIVEKLDYMSKHTMGQYGPTRISNPFDQPGIEENDPFLVFYGREISNNISYMKSSNIISMNINETHFTMRYEDTNYLRLYEVLEVSISKKQGDVVKYTSEKYKFTKTSDDKYEVVIPLGSTGAPADGEAWFYNLYFLYRDNIFFSSQI